MYLKEQHSTKTKNNQRLNKLESFTQEGKKHKQRIRMKVNGQSILIQLKFSSYQNKKNKAYMEETEKKYKNEKKN